MIMIKKEIFRYIIILVIGIVVGICVISAIRPPVDITPVPPVHPVRFAPETPV